MPVAVAEAGPVAITTAGGTTLTVKYPFDVNDLLSELVLLVGQKPATANGGTITGPSGWTQRVASLAQGGYGATLGSGTGNTNLWMYTKDVPSAADSGTTLAITLGDTDVAWGMIVRLVKSEPGSITWANSVVGEATSGAINHTFPAIALTAGDLLLHGITQATAVNTPIQFDAWTATQAGSTVSAGIEIVEPDNGNGNQLGGGVSFYSVTAGGATATVQVTANVAGLSTDARGAAGLLRARFTPSSVPTHYRWGLDDGTEAAHTFAAAEDTPITVAAAQRRLLRVQVDEQAGIDRATGFTLQYRRTDEGATEWRDI